MKKQQLKRVLRWILLAPISLCLIMVGSPHSVQAQEYLFTDRIDIWSDPDINLTGGMPLNSFYETKKYQYVYREIIPTEVGGNTYFAILGTNHGKDFPTFYGGIQQYKDGTRYAIFSAWDVGSDTQCASCKEGSAPESQKVTVWAKGPRTVTRPFGNEGTGMNSMIHGFDWKLGEKVGMLVSVEPAGEGSLISAALRIGNNPWEFMTSFYVPTRYAKGMPGNYSFLEDWTGGDENLARSYWVGPAYLVEENGSGEYFTQALINSSNISGTRVPNRHTISVDGSWLKIRSGTSVQENFTTSRVVIVAKPSTTPDISDGKALLEKVVEGKSTREIERVKRIEMQQKLEEEAKAKAKAELEAKTNVPKKITITCRKGKLVKKVTSLNPKCPKGYQRR